MKCKRCGTKIKEGRICDTCMRIILFEEEYGGLNGLI